MENISQISKSVQNRSSLAALVANRKSPVRNMFRKCLASLALAPVASPIPLPRITPIASQLVQRSAFHQVPRESRPPKILITGQLPRHVDLLNLTASKADRNKFIIF